MLPASLAQDVEGEGRRVIVELVDDVVLLRIARRVEFVQRVGQPESPLLVRQQLAAGDIPADEHDTLLLGLEMRGQTIATAVGCRQRLPAAVAGRH